MPIIAPEGFLAEAVAENVIAGPAMLRRSAYMYGMMLAPGPDGHVDCGLGKATPMGSVAILAPTVEISTTGTEMVVDGVRIVFQNTPGSEAPAEMNFFFPDHGWLCMAENCSHTMHNLYTPRGAQVRDALVWSKYIGEALELFGDDTDIMFASHHWPRWGRDDVRDFLVRQRDVYRWLHDQTMRLANHGETAVEIAEELELPPEFSANGDTRPYYGTVSHNAKAVYQRYLGWFDANPANLQPLPPVEASVRYVEFMGGADAVLAKARVSLRRRRLPLGRAGRQPRRVRRTRPTSRPERCRPTPSSSSATRPSRARGATSTSPAPTSSATAPRRRDRPSCDGR